MENNLTREERVLNEIIKAEVLEERRKAKEKAAPEEKKVEEKKTTSRDPYQEIVDKYKRRRAL